MKRMATKLLRLTADEKKEARKEVHPLTGEVIGQAGRSQVRLGRSQTGQASKNECWSEMSILVQYPHRFYLRHFIFWHHIFSCYHQQVKTREFCTSYPI